MNGEKDMPGEAVIVDVLLRVIGERQPVPVDEVFAVAGPELGLDPAEQSELDALEWALQAAVEYGPVDYISGDRLVHVDEFTDRIYLTHRLTDPERRLDVLEVGLDLGWSGRSSELNLPDGEEIVVFSEAHGHAAWEGPEGWLSAWQEGTLLAIRVTGGMVEISALAEEPPVDPDLVTRLRAAYDQSVAEPWLPVTGDELVLELLAGDPDTFVTPRPPLSELCAAAGLEQRGSRVAHEESVWERDAITGLQIRILDRVSGDAALAALDAVQTATLEDPGELAMRKALCAMRDLDVAGVVLDEVVPVDDPDPEDDGRAVRWAERLVAAATKPADVALARWTSAVVAERMGEVLEAEQQIALALEADPEFAVAIDWAAWYASDRGDAGAAWRLWHLLSEPSPDDLRVLEPFTRTAGRTPGRNDPCWCGSGRKYKTCHIGQPAAIPLPDRIQWLCRKAVAYLERRGGQAIEDFADAAAARAVDPDDEDSVAEAMEDPLVFDVVLTEGGWFEEFLADRGMLLPPDEAALLVAWAGIPRTVYQIDDVRPGETVTVKDLRSGVVTEVRERTASLSLQPGDLICARAVPDGVSHQLIGAVITVPHNQAEAVLEMCEEGVPEEICAWASTFPSSLFGARFR